MLRRVALLACLLAGLSDQTLADTPAPTETRTLRLCFEASDVWPWRTRGQTGMNFVMLDAVAQELGLRLIYRGLPWRRCQDALRDGRVDGSFGMSHTPEREALGRFPPGTPPDARYRMFEGGYVLVRRRGAPPRIVDGRITGLDGPIGAEAGTSIALDLARRGHVIDDGATDPAVQVRKLAAGRIAAAAIGSDQWQNLQRSGHPSLSLVEAVEPMLVRKPYFLVLSNSFVEREPALARALWTQIEAVRESADYQTQLDAARSRGP